MSHLKSAYSTNCILFNVINEEVNCKECFQCRGSHHTTQQTYNFSQKVLVSVVAPIHIGIFVQQILQPVLATTYLTVYIQYILCLL